MTGVQTCALPISNWHQFAARHPMNVAELRQHAVDALGLQVLDGQFYGVHGQCVMPLQSGATVLHAAAAHQNETTIPVPMSTLLRLNCKVLGSWKLNPLERSSRSSVFQAALALIA